MPEQGDHRLCWFPFCNKQADIIHVRVGETDLGDYCVDHFDENMRRLVIKKVEEKPPHDTDEA